jgi:hypothetical protein
MNYYGENQLHKVDHNKGEHNINPYPKGFGLVNVPEGKSQKWTVKKFTVPNTISTDLMNLRYIRDGRRDRVVPPGSYTKLCFDGETVMSDTPAEANELAKFYKAAKGSVLVSGLGLGFALAAILRKKNNTVTAVTVVEKSKDVIKLVKPSIDDPRVTIINADITTWPIPADAKWDAIWHDIWTDISESNKREMVQLQFRFAKHTKWQGFWSEDYL